MAKKVKENDISKVSKEAKTVRTPLLFFRKNDTIANSTHNYLGFKKKLKLVGGTKSGVFRNLLHLKLSYCPE